jgi:mRNA interferase MazF
MRRGYVITIALQGDYGKPRPALIVQSDSYLDRHPSLLVCPITSYVRDLPLLWVTVDPTPNNGLRRRSQIMTDRIATTKPDRVGPVIGHVDSDVLERVDRALALILGLGR